MGTASSRPSHAAEDSRSSAATDKGHLVLDFERDLKAITSMGVDVGMHALIKMLGDKYNDICNNEIKRNLAVRTLVDKYLLSLIKDRFLRNIPEKHEKLVFCFEYYPIVKQLFIDEPVVGPGYDGAKKLLIEFYGNEAKIPAFDNKFVRSNARLSKFLECCNRIRMTCKPDFYPDRNVPCTVYRQVLDIIQSPKYEPELATPWKSGIADRERRTQLCSACSGSLVSATGAGESESEKAP